MKRLVITTVGTSLMDKMNMPGKLEIRGLNRNPDNVLSNEQDSQNATLSKDIETACGKITMQGAIRFTTSDPLVQKAVNRLKKLTPNSPTLGHRYAAPAEIASLWALNNYLQEQHEPTFSKDNGDRVVLLYSDTPEGVFCARSLQTYLNDHSNLVKCDWSTDVKCVKALHAEGPQAYQNWDKAVKKLAELLGEELDRAKKEDYKAWLNITGGYKGITPFSSLLGLLNEIPVVYLYETSDGLIRLPKIPLQLDLEAYELNSHLIHVILIGGGTPEAVGLPRNLHACVEPSNGDWKLTIWGELLETLSKREGRIGGARVMVEDYWTDHNLRNEVLKRVERVAQYLRVECKTPHIVTHGREHLGRLLEFVDEIFIPILDQEKNLPESVRTFSCADLYTFSSYIWLHDIGHISGHLRCYCHTEVIDHPAVIRDLHHLLSEQRIKDEGKERFAFCDDNRIQPVAKVAAYHRYAMPLHDSDDDPYEYKKDYYDGTPIYIKEPPPETMGFQHNGKDLQVKVRFLAALARVVDACDVQRRRAGEPFYQQWRQMFRKQDIEIEQSLVTRYEKDFNEIKNLLGSDEKTKVLDWILNNMCARIDFNLKQELHFEKHNQIDRVWWQQGNPFKDIKDNYHFSIIIQQTKLDDVREVRREDKPPATVEMARAYFKQSGVECGKFKSEVQRYFPNSQGQSLANQIDALRGNINTFLSSLSGRDNSNNLSNEEESEYSYHIVHLVAFDIVKEYAKVHDIMNINKLFLDDIKIRWADNRSETICLHLEDAV